MDSWRINDGYKFSIERIQIIRQVSALVGSTIFKIELNLLKRMFLITKT